MPPPFGLDPLALSPGKPAAFEPTLRDRLIMRALQQARRRPQGAPLPSPSLVEPLRPPGVFGPAGQLDVKTGFESFHLPPSFPENTLRDLFMSLLQGGQFRI